MIRGRTHRTATRALRHRGQGGLTLTELLVCIAVLAIIGTCMSLTFDIGFKTVGAAGADARLSGTNSISSLERSIGTDVGRASCLLAPKLPGSLGTTVYGGDCALIFPTTGSNNVCTTTAGAFLCLAWPQPLDSTCHLAVYSWQNLNVDRQEWSLSGTTLTSVGSSPITLGGVSSPTVTLTPITVPEAYGTPYPWASSVSVSVASTAVTTNVPTASFTFWPLVQDPAAGYTSC